MKKGILLDVDGTLWDAVKVIRDSWNEYRKRSIPEMPGEYSEADIRGVLGMTMTEIGDILLSPLLPERRKQAMEGLMEYEVAYMWQHGGEVYTDVKKSLGILKEKGYTLCIVSNCQKGYIEDFLHASGTGSLIDDHVCFGDTGKPKNVSMKVCMERNGISRAVYVGDTKGDLDSSRIAGIPFIYAEYGFGSVDIGKEKVASIRTFAALPEAAEKIFQG